MAQRVISAAGAVVWRNGTVAVVHRPRYDDWTLPKGKLDRGETVPQAAVRELAEETGFEVVLGRHLNTVRYSVGDSVKQVDYFAARTIAGHFVPNDEVDELRWLAVEQAAGILSYPQDAAVLAEFTRQPAETTSVLLVRHAKAGKREIWPGPDSLRPLSAAGVRQAEALRGLLPLFGPERMYSAPPERCVQTIAGAADDLGRTVVVEPALGEQDYSGDTEAGIRRLLAIAGGDGPAVVCSQGGVIPGLITALARQSGLDLPEVRAKKASVWLLSFVHPGPRLIGADYFPTPLPKP